MKWIFGVMLMASSICVFAQKGDLVLKFNGNYGLPIMSKNIKSDNVILGAINTQAGLNFGLGYKVSNRFQVSALLGIDFLNINKNTFQTQVLSKYLLSNSSLYRLTPQRTAVENYYVALELKYCYQFKGWQIAPLFMSRFFTGNNTFTDIELYEKTPNEHYYKNTKWQRAPSENNSNNNEPTLDFSPAYFSTGIEISKHIYDELNIISSIQYIHTTLQFEMNKTEAFFNQQSVYSTESFYQRYRGISVQIGLELKISSYRRQKVPNKI